MGPAINWDQMNIPWEQHKIEIVESIKRNNKRAIDYAPCSEGFKNVNIHVRFGRLSDEIDPKNKYLLLQIASEPDSIRMGYLYFGPYYRDFWIRDIPTCNLGADGRYGANLGISIYDTATNRETGFGGQNSADIFKWDGILVDLYPEGIDPGGPDSAGTDYRVVHELK